MAKAALYGKLFLAVFNKEVDWISDDIYASLHTSSYAPAQDTDDYFDDVTNELSTGSGYTAGGALLSGKTITYTGATNITMLDADDVEWTASTLTARFAVIYDGETAVASTSPLICWENFEADVSTVSGTFTLTWSADGIVEITTEVESA